VISNTLVRRAVQLEYSLLRTPLAVVNRGLASRLRKDSKVRAGVERGLGTLDAVAGQLLSPPSTERRNGSSSNGSGEQRAKSPAAADVPADGNVESTHDEIELSHDDEVERVVHEIREELDEKPVTGELADPELQEVQAELRARHLVEEYEDEQRIKREHEERVRIANAARKAPAKKAAKKAAKSTPAKSTPAKATARAGAAAKATAKKAPGAR
jgi:hypothetical protein